MSGAWEDMTKAVFDASDTSDARYLISSTPIGPVMFGSDGSMKYGDNFSDDVPPALQEEARISLAEHLKKKP